MSTTSFRDRAVKNYIGMRVQLANQEIWVDKQSVKDAFGATHKAIDALKGVVAFATPENMRPVTVGSLNDFRTWAAKATENLFGDALGEASIGTLLPEGDIFPQALKDQITKVADAPLTIYRAAFATGMRNADGTRVTYFQLAFGLELVDAKLGPLAVKEIILSVSNLPATD